MSVDTGAEPSTQDSVDTPPTVSDRPMALFKFRVPASDSPVVTHYPQMFDDIARMLCIQFSVQLMAYLSDATNNAGFFTSDFMALLVYIIIGVMAYWLVYKNLVHLS